MTIPSNYEINVATEATKDAKYGKHFCTIELGSCLPQEAKAKFAQIKGFFPTNWNLTLQEVRCSIWEVER